MWIPTRPRPAVRRQASKLPVRSPVFISSSVDRVGARSPPAPPVPTGGIGAIGIVDAGDYPLPPPTCSLPPNFTASPPPTSPVTWPGTKPPVYSGWLTEERWISNGAHAMAPQPKLFLGGIQSLQNTDPTWGCRAGWRRSWSAGKRWGVVSMSWGDPEVAKRNPLGTNSSPPRESSTSRRRATPHRREHLSRRFGRT